jgi:hypothetical protein
VCITAYILAISLKFVIKPFTYIIFTTLSSILYYCPTTMSEHQSRSQSRNSQDRSRSCSHCSQHNKRKQSAFKPRCRNGQSCRFLKNGNCKFYHPHNESQSANNRKTGQHQSKAHNNNRSADESKNKELLIMLEHSIRASLYMTSTITIQLTGVLTQQNRTQKFAELVQYLTANSLSNY